jgi:vitamin B12 transporter
MSGAREGRAHGPKVVGLFFMLLLWVATLAPPAEAQEDVFSLDGLVVTATPTPLAEAAVSSSVTVLLGGELRARGVGTVLDALRGVPGVDVVRGGSFGAQTSVFMRGGESDYVLVLIDGVQVNQPGGSFDFASLTLANVARIEVLRGPASALYGSDAVAGVIQIITRTGAGGTSGGVSTRVGSYGRRDWAADVQGGGARAAYTLSLSRLETDGILDFNNGHTNTVLSGSARLAPDEATRVDLTLRAGDRTFRFPTDFSGNVVDRNSFTFSDQTTLGVRLRRRLGDALSLEARLGLNNVSSGLDDTKDGPADTLGFYGFTSLDDFRRSSADVRANLRLDDLVLTGGWEFEEERQRSFTESASQYGSSNGRSENRRLNRAYYAHASGSRGAISLQAGARAEDNERFGAFTTWQAGLNWAVSEAAGTRLRFSAGRGLKEPTFFETFATGFARGNPELKPERSRSWEVGADQRLFGGRGTLRATYFSQSFEDLIQFTFSPPSADDPNYFNVAAATSRGLEVEVSGAAGPLFATASWTRLDTEVTDSGFDEGPGASFVTGEALLRRPRNSVEVSGGAEVGARGRIFGAVNVVGARADRDFTTFPASEITLPRHTLLSLGAEWAVSAASGARPAISLVIRGENLLDRRYSEVFGFRAPGRALYLGLSARFGG